MDSCPDESLPEFAFIGRSNAGKSSLLNMLSGRPDMARVSSTPGFTKLINLFMVNHAWRLVDLPGYGFAQVARKDRSQFNQAVNHYLLHRTNLCCVFALIDSGLKPQEIDVEFVGWLAQNAVPFVLVFTKTDRVSAEAVQENIAAFKDRIAQWFQQLPVIFFCSSVTGQGRSDLLGVIQEAMTAIQAAARESGVTRAAARKAIKLRKKRPDLNRPW